MDDRLRTVDHAPMNILAISGSRPASEPKLRRCYLVAVGYGPRLLQRALPAFLPESGFPA
jgi:hypothetical protein